MKTLLVVLVALTAAVAVPVAHAQQPTPETAPSTPPAQAPIPAGQAPTFRSGVDLLSIDVAVVDRSGRPVEDLRAPEFSVTIDGEARRVVSAELVKVDVEAAKKQVADKSETFFTTNMTPPHGRLIVLAIDQTNIRPGAIKPIMNAASRFLDRLSPLDQVALFTFPEPGPRVSFTSDKLRLRLAMERLIGHQSGMNGLQFNIGASEAIALNDKRDQVVLATVVARECRGFDVQQRSQCERDILNEAAIISRRVREDADKSVMELRQLLERLRTVEGPKSLILISEGLAIQDPGEIASLVAVAGRARASINVLQVELGRGDVTIAEQPPTEAQDRRLQLQGLETLATMSRGSMFFVVGTGEPIFERLASEISAYYVLGVEQRPSDAQGDRHRVDVSVRRRDVTIRSRQAFVLSTTPDRKLSAEEHLRDALFSPFPVSGLPLRVTTFAQQDPASEKVRLIVAAEVAQPGAAPAEYTVGFAVINDQNQVTTSFLDRQTLSPAGGGGTEALHFRGGVLVDPGVYSLRFGVVDSEGRRGSVIRDVNAWKLTGEELALGDLIVGSLPAPQGLRAAVEPHVSGDGLGAYLELYSTTASTFDAASVTFEIGDDADSVALASVTARLAPAAQPSWRTATAALATQALPPGRYVMRARIVRDGKPAGLLARPFVVERGDTARTVSPQAVSAAAVSFAGTLPRFERDAVLARDVLDVMLELAAKRSPALKDAVAEARAGRYGPAALEALSAGDQAAAAFLRGLDFYVKNQLDQAAAQLHIAAGERREFFPAAFYLGAAFAAVGRDRDAAGTWQMALGTEPRPAAIYAMVADARLRDGQPASAVDILKPVFEREPTHDGIAKRLGMAYMMTARYAEAVPVLDAYLTRQPADQDILLAAIVAQYEVTRAGQTLSNDDRVKLRKYSAAYSGANAALVEKYLQTIGAR